MYFLLLSFESIQIFTELFQGDLFGGLNDGLLSRAEALVDIGKHPGASPPVTGLPQLKHDMMYHPSMGPPHPGHNPRPHQVRTHIKLKIKKIAK